MSSNNGHMVAAQLRMKEPRLLACWRRKGGSLRIPRSPGVALRPTGPPHSPTVGPAILTKEGTTVEADGGLARDLSPIKNCIIELVREGKGLWVAEEHRVSYELRQMLVT